jgi:16S rRNA processing protein RimM
MNEFLPIGFTEKPHGISGELKLRINEAYLADLADLEMLYIVLKGKPTPYFIAELRGGTKLIAKFEDIDSREDALVISSQEVWVRTTDLKTPTDEARSLLHFANLVGYTIIDTNEGVIGVIDEIIEMPMQELAVVQYQQREVLIPLHQQFIGKIDATHKTVQTDLPEGLLAL